MIFRAASRPVDILNPESHQPAIVIRCPPCLKNGMDMPEMEPS